MIYLSDLIYRKGIHRVSHLVMTFLNRPLVPKNALLVIEFRIMPVGFAMPEQRQ